MNRSWTTGLHSHSPTTEGKSQFWAPYRVWTILRAGDHEHGEEFNEGVPVLIAGRSKGVNQHHCSHSACELRL